jgi:ADP-ribose pyrophosphatase
MSNSPKINKTETLYKSDWLTLQKAHWQKSNGQEFTWEYVNRNKCSNIVMTIPIMKHSGNHVLVKQYRAPLNNFTLEFPAGLVDIGEDLDIAALRELKEETGYSGKILSCQNDRAVSAGLCSEIISIFNVEIDEKDPVNLNPQQNLDECEELEVIVFSKEDLIDIVMNSKCTEIIDIKLSLYCSGLLK